MPNLTNEQCQLLEWMSKGNRFSVCSDYCPDNWQVVTASPCPIRIFKKTILKLYQQGLIGFQPEISYGLRWDEFSITRQGRLAI